MIILAFSYFILFKYYILGSILFINYGDSSPFDQK